MSETNDSPRWGARLLLCVVTGVIISGTSYYCAFVTYENNRHLRSPQHLTMQRLDSLRAVIESHKETMGDWPKRLTDLPVVKAKRFQVDDDGQPVDEWGRALHYQVDENGFRLFSYGRDGKPGGEGEDTDLFAGEPEPREPPLTLVEFATRPQALVVQIPCIVAGLVAIPVLVLNARGQPGKRPSMLKVVLANIVTAVFAIVAALTIATLHLVPGGH